MTNTQVVPLNEIFSKKKEQPAQEKPAQYLAQRARVCSLLMPKTQ